MNILITQENYYPLHNGGTIQFVHWLAGYLKKHGNQTRIFTRAYAEHDLLGLQQFQGIDVEYSPHMIGSMERPFSAMKYVRNFAEYIKDNNIDLVFSNNHNSLAWISAAKEAGIPVIYGCHGVGLIDPLRSRFLSPQDDILWSFPTIKEASSLLWQEDGSSIKKIMKWTLFFFPLSLPEHIRNYWRTKKGMHILDSAHVRYGNSEITSRLFFNQKHTYGFPLAINAQDESLGFVYKPVRDDNLLKKFGLDHKSYILCPGRIHHIKGQEYMLEAFAQMKSNNRLLLVFAGSTDLFDNKQETALSVYEKKLRDRAQTLGIQNQIIFTGTCDFEEMRSLYTSALISVIPSVWLETFGYVTTESLACETPVIVTENCGSASVVTSDIGFVVARKDSDAIAHAILSKTHDEFIEMGARGRKHILAINDWAAAGHRYLDIIEDAMSQ